MTKTITIKLEHEELLSIVTDVVFEIFFGRANSIEAFKRGLQDLIDDDECLELFARQFEDEIVKKLKGEKQ